MKSQVAYANLRLEWHYGAAVGEPFNTSTICPDIELLKPELLINWGPNTRDGDTIQVCGDKDIKFLPTLWGQTWDDPILAKLPNDTAPWGIFLENEPNWWGFQPLTAEHGAGANLTAEEVARRYKGHADLINAKWGKGKVKLISPSPITTLYAKCKNGEKQGCYFQSQLDYLDEFFAKCNCFDDMWAINLHEYSCHVDRTQEFVKTLNDKYPGKNIFLGELGCDGPPVEEQAKYLTDFAAWASTQDTITGFIWTGVNDVGAKNEELSVNGKLTPLGEAFKNIQQKYPVKEFSPNEPAGEPVTPTPATSTSAVPPPETPTPAPQAPEQPAQDQPTPEQPAPEPPAPEQPGSPSTGENEGEDECDAD